MATNLSTLFPSLPEYTLSPQPRLVSWIEDKYLTLLSPIVAYWVYSLIFHVIDTYDFFPQYRLHTPAEILKRNHASRWDVVRDVIIQQVVQTIFGCTLAYFDPDPTVGKENYDIAVWAQRVRTFQHHIPVALATLGLDSQRLASKLTTTSPTLSVALYGGPSSFTAFSPWELRTATFIYHAVVPVLQFALAIIIVDTWQYFLHRAMHTSRYLYTTFHSRHHRLYVPYAYGALYNHPVEGFLLDTAGTGLAYLVAGLSARQSLVFFTFATLKTVDDHCGYKLPFDPLQLISGNNAAYHDVHHQSWGVKTNFSQPFFTFWDRLLGTVWKGGDVSARYERTRLAAERKTAGKPAADTVAQAKEQARESTAQLLDDPTGAGGSPQIVAEAAEEDKEFRQRAAARRTPKKRVSANETGASSLMGRVRSSSGGTGFHGSKGGVLGWDAAGR